MQTIKLVPDRFNKSIYISGKKNCNDGVIVLEHLVTEYYMNIQSTTAISIDERLLNNLSYSTIKFTLTVYSTGNNVLNLSGFNVEQIQVLNGESHFTIMKEVGDANWNIQMTSSDVRSLQYFKCYIVCFNGNRVTDGYFTYTNAQMTNYNYDRMNGMFSYDPFVVPNTGFGPFNIKSNTGIIYARFPTPILIKSICTGITNNTSYALSTFPTSFQVYGSNDGVIWTQIFNDSITNSRGTEDHQCTTTNYYTFFRFDFVFSSTSNIYFPSVALTGFIGDLINTGTIYGATPFSNSMPIGSGYDIEVNSSQMSSTEGNLSYLTKFWGDTSYKMVRSNGNTPWEFTYTFPEPIRTIGINAMIRQTEAIALFTLSYSDDKETWTEYCKVNGTIDAWNQSIISNQVVTYFYDSRSKHKYYKITIYSNAYGSNTLNLDSLVFIQYQPGIYFDFESFIPKLSSNTQAGYMLIASSATDGDAYKMFDQSVTTYGGGQITDGEWSLLISLPQATVVRGLEMIAPPSEVNRMPYAFSLQGSQDNDTWTTIKQFLLGSNYWNSAYQLGQWDVENETAYSYYRLVVTNTAQGSYVRIGELGLSSYASFKGVNWYEDEYPVPVMSSNSQDGYVASAKSQYSNTYAPWKAFDRTTNNSDDCWACSNGDQTNSNKECNVWLQIQLPTAQVFNALNIVSRTGNMQNQAPSSFILKGSNDEETWTDLLTVTNQATYNSKSWSFENSTAYSYYRIDISKTNGANTHVSIAQFDLINRIYHNTLEGE